MSNLFKKAAVFTDLHLGLKNNSIRHNTDCEEFVDWMIDTAVAAGCETALFLGDWHDHRASINVHTLNFSIRILEKINAAFGQTFFIPGNHDLYYRNRREVHGIEWAKHLPNIHIVNDWFNEGDVSIVPWLVGDDYKRLSKIQAKYMFGHFELPHFKLNDMVAMPDHGNIQTEQLMGVGHVFSGHFHLRQHRGNVTYIGNAFPHNFSDAGDSDRGMMILPWGGEPEFYSWPDQPLYINTRLGQLLDEADTILKPKMTAKVVLDIPISFEEACFVKDTFIEKYGLREISLVPNVVDEHSVDSLSDLSVNNIATVIAEQIASITSETYKPELLMEIYQSL